MAAMTEGYDGMRRALIRAGRFCAACGLLLCLAVLSAAPGRAENPAELARMPVLGVPERQMLGRRLISLHQGDLVFPALSPDGRRVAYSRVIVRNSTELTEIAVTDLKTRRTQILLDGERSRDYGVYKAYVSSLAWKDAHRVAALIHDGDVDAVRATFDIRSGALVSRQETSHDEEMGAMLARAEKQRRSLGAQPDMPRDVLINALTKGFALKGGGFVIQKQYAGHDDHIWLLRPDGTLLRLLTLPDGRPGGMLQGGFAHRGDIVFLVSQTTAEKGEYGDREYARYYRETAYLILHRGGKARVMATFGPLPLGTVARLAVVWRDAGQVLFTVLTRPIRERPITPGLFLLHRGRLTRQPDMNLLIGASADRRARRLALNIWEGAARRVDVHVLRR